MQVTQIDNSDRELYYRRSFLSFEHELVWIHGRVFDKTANRPDTFGIRKADRVFIDPRLIRAGVRNSDKANNHRVILDSGSTERLRDHGNPAIQIKTAEIINAAT